MSDADRADAPADQTLAFTTYFADQEPIDGNLTVVDLAATSCRWPTGNPRDLKTFRYCGKVALTALLRAPRASRLSAEGRLICGRARDVDATTQRCRITLHAERKASELLRQMAEHGERDPGGEGAIRGRTMRP
jgi:hypothetical protein